MTKGVPEMISDRDVALIANAQRHVPLPEETIAHFAKLGLEPADLYGAVQHLATVVACDPHIRAGGSLAEPTRELVLSALLDRMSRSTPLIAGELLRNPYLLARAAAPRRGDLVVGAPLAGDLVSSASTAEPAAV
jgi:hypothetical protein